MIVFKLYILSYDKFNIPKVLHESFIFITNIINKELIINDTDIKKGKNIYLFFVVFSEYDINIINTKGITKKIIPNKNYKKE